MMLEEKIISKGIQGTYKQQSCNRLPLAKGIKGSMSETRSDYKVKARSGKGALATFQGQKEKQNASR